MEVGNVFGSQRPLSRKFRFLIADEALSLELMIDNNVIRLGLP
jgi:hypothetical protein